MRWVQPQDMGGAPRMSLKCRWLWPKDQLFLAENIKYSKQKRIWKVVLADGRVAEVTSHGAFVQNQNGTRSGHHVFYYITYHYRFHSGALVCIIEVKHVCRQGPRLTLKKSASGSVDLTCIYFNLMCTGASINTLMRLTFGLRWGAPAAVLVFANAKYFEGIFTWFSQKLFTDIVLFEIDKNTN